MSNKSRKGLKEEPEGQSGGKKKKKRKKLKKKRRYTFKLFYMQQNMHVQNTIIVVFSLQNTLSIQVTA